MVSSNEIKKNLGKNLKILRKKSGLSQEKLGELINLERVTIKNIETGSAFISSESLAKIVNYFNIEPEQLFKNQIQELSSDDLEIKKEINRILSSFNSENLKRMYKIAVALKM